MQLPIVAFVEAATDGLSDCLSSVFSLLAAAATEEASAVD